MSTPARRMCLGSTGDERDGRGHQKSRVERLHLRRLFFPPDTFLSRPQRACARRVPQCMVPKICTAELGRRHGQERCEEERDEGRCSVNARACGPTVPHPAHALEGYGAQLSLLRPDQPRLYLTGRARGLVSLSTVSTLERGDIRCVASERTRHHCFRKDAAVPLQSELAVSLRGVL